MLNSKGLKLLELADKQECLDILYYEKAGIEKPSDDNKCLCLVVELGELVNEVQVWKYWKSNKNVDKSKIEKEFADCLHFALSNLNHFSKSQSKEYEQRKKELRIKRAIEDYEQWIESFFLEDEKDDALVEELLKAFRKACRGYSASFLGQILVIGHLLDMSFDDMVEAYKKIYADNLMRVQGDY